MNETTFQDKTSMLDYETQFWTLQFFSMNVLEISLIFTLEKNLLGFEFFYDCFQKRMVTRFMDRRLPITNLPTPLKSYVFYS